MPNPIRIAAAIALALLVAPACSSSPQQCMVSGLEHPVGKPFTLPGCGTCTCDAYGDVSCGDIACSGPGHARDGAAGASGSDAEAGADSSPGDGSDLATSD